MNKRKSLDRIFENRWQAVVRRDPTARDQFVYAVRSTGIYCRPNCPSRRPNRENTEFFETAVHARLAGYRPCRRCRPDLTHAGDPAADRVIRACRFIEQSDGVPRLLEIARHVALSSNHLHRLFRRHLGISPKEYAGVQRVNRLQSALGKNGRSVTESIFAAGYKSSGRCYTAAKEVLGMTPKQYRDRGSEVSIRYAIVGCFLGRLLVAVTDRGVCRIAFGDSDNALRKTLQEAFPAAEEIKPDAKFRKLLRQVVAFIETPTRECQFPLDIRGTAFQQKVWRALQRVPPGETRSYSALAKQLGLPKSVRAVASACAANQLAVVIPCHRVLRSNGELSGYRWGPARKKVLLQREVTHDP